MWNNIAVTCGNNKGNTVSGGSITIGIARHWQMQLNEAKWIDISWNINKQTNHTNDQSFSLQHKCSKKITHLTTNSTPKPKSLFSFFIVIKFKSLSDYLSFYCRHRTLHNLKRTSKVWNFRTRNQDDEQLESQNQQISIPNKRNEKQVHHKFQFHEFNKSNQRFIRKAKKPR